MYIDIVRTCSHDYSSQSVCTTTATPLPSGHFKIVFMVREGGEGEEVGYINSGIPLKVGTPLCVCSMEVPVIQGLQV